MANNQTNTSTMYLVSAIFSGIAAILLTFTDFGGFYYYEYYSMGSYFEMWVYVFLFSNLLYTILVIPLIAGFIYTIYLLQEPIRLNTELEKSKIELLWKISLGTLAVVVFGLIVFIIESFEASEWWLDAAFFGSIIGAGINIYVFNLLRGKPIQGKAYVPSKNINTSEAAQTQTRFCMECGHDLKNSQFCKKCGTKAN